VPTRLRDADGIHTFKLTNTLFRPVIHIVLTPARAIVHDLVRILTPRLANPHLAPLQDVIVNRKVEIIVNLV
jgi:hypothetical protein